MPGLSGRMSTIVKSKISKLLDRAEDPGETLEYSYQKQIELLQNVKKGIADVVTSKKRLQLQEENIKQQVVKLDTQARQALAAGQEDLARTALERKNVAQTELQSLDQQIAHLDAAIEEQLRPFAAELARLDTIPGVGVRAAHEIIAAIGTDMSRWPSVKHFCRWLGRVPVACGSFCNLTNRVKCSHFSTCMRGFCHGLASFVLPAHADRTRLAVRYAPLGVAQRRPHVSTAARAYTPSAKAAS